jgi:hypothetical protein
MQESAAVLRAPAAFAAFDPQAVFESRRKGKAEA